MVLQSEVMAGGCGKEVIERSPIWDSPAFGKVSEEELFDWRKVRCGIPIGNDEKGAGAK